MTDTSVCRLTGTGRSAVAVVAVFGPDADSMIAACFHPATVAAFRVGQIRYGVWRSPTVNDSGADDGLCVGDDGESVVLTPVRDNHFEIHGHGGTVAVSRIVASLIEQGGVEISASQFSRIVDSSLQTFNEPLIHEAEQVLIRCTTQSSAAIVLDQTRGELLRWTIGWIQTVTEALAEGASVESQRETLAAVTAAAGELFDRRSIGSHLVTPYRVVLAGPPNVGKSSLVNRILGYGRSIIHDEAGTTRDVVESETVIAGLPIRIGDTAGIRVGGGVIEREGIRRGAVAIGAADLIVMVVDPESWDDGESIRQSIQSLCPSTPVLKVLNKSDLIDLASSVSLTPDWLPTMARDAESETATESDPNADGIDRLTEAIASTLRPEPYRSAMPVPITPRQLKYVQGISVAMDLRSVRGQLARLRDGSPADS